MPELSLETLHRQCRAFLDRRLSYAQLNRTLQAAKERWGDTELWKAAKQALKAGRHEGPCDNDQDPDNDACSIHLKHFHERMDRMAKALK